MDVKVLTFGIIKDITGSGLLHVDIPEGANVGELLRTMIVLYPDLRGIKSIAVAIDNVYATQDTSIAHNVEVALIPPVSGG
jgi:molybdopterin synthase sulfur carrier subunit